MLTRPQVSLDRFTEALRWNPPPQQIKQALKLLQPSPELREECKLGIDGAFCLVRLAKETPALSGKEQKERFRRFAEKLRAVEANGRNLVPDSFLEQVTRYRKEYETLAEKTVPRKAGQRRDLGKQIATLKARELIENFGVSRPTLTRGGPWHQLATTLFGSADAELFDYLREYRRDYAALAYFRDLLGR